VIRVENLHVRAGTFTLQEISFEIPSGHYGVLVGRTGSGKTTILEALCGLRHIVSGRIELMGRNVTRLKPAERGIGFVPQDAALFTSMSVRDQIGFALSIRKAPNTAERVEELAELLGVAHLLDRTPSGLSGGERQRVSLGRALAARPGVLCLDEPLSALDQDTWAEMCQLLKSVQQQTGVTVLHITHNMSEVSQLADVVLELQHGRIRRVAPTTEPGSAADGDCSPI
jgi:molybdate/tungstate transport system ATP-binding protein